MHRVDGPPVRRRTSGMLAALVCAALVTAGCADMDGRMAGDGMQDMDDMAMGDMAELTVAGEAAADRLPREPLGWVGYRMAQADAGGEVHAWGPAFLYAADQARTVDVDGSEMTLGPGEAVFVDEGVEHTAPDGDFWAFLLTDPDADPPAGLQDATREVSSGPLEGLPAGSAELRFLIVDLPPQGGQTTVHTHPGPEFIYVTHGRIEYETGLAETTGLGAGDAAALPAETAVQKRNVSDDPARFWSWFVVDPSQPFASETTFDRG